jgi:membrane fusion protein, multidrug efflux system
MATAGTSWARLGVKLALIGLVLAGVGSGGWFLASRDRGAGQKARAAHEQSQPQQAIPVLGAVAQAQNFAIVVRGIGNVVAFNTVAVKSRVDGHIVRVAFAEGQFINAGDLLVQIDPRPYQTQLAQAEANKAKDQANLENAQRDLDRYTILLKDQLAATRQQYDTQHALVAQLQAAVQSDQAQIDAANLNIAYSAITSPISGITGLRLLDIGNLVQASAGTTLVVVTQVQPIYVTFTVPERNLDRIRQAMAQHHLSVLAFDSDDKNQISQGVLELVNNTVDQSTGMVTLKARFANQIEGLWPGEFVNAHLVLNVVDNGVTVPAAAVQMGSTGPFVFLIKDDSRIEARSVTIIDVDNNTALIGAGLQAGDKVVVSGQTNLVPGAKVSVRPGSPGGMVSREPQIGPEGVGSTGVTTGPAGVGGLKPR